MNKNIFISNKKNIKKCNNTISEKSTVKINKNKLCDILRNIDYAIKILNTKHPKQLKN